MICFIALIVFAILGTFSATHRPLAKEAFDCVFRRITLRKCNTGFDRKMKMKISASLLKKNKAVGGFVFKHFELISWALTILMIVSLIYSAIGIYNFVVYGDCNPQNPGNCVYDSVLGTNQQSKFASDKNLQGISQNPDINCPH